MAKKKIKGMIEAPETTTTPAPMILHDGILYQYFENDIMKGYQPAMPAPEKKAPTLRWKGSKMAWETYCQMISFFRWTYKETKGESQVRLAYKVATEEWGIVVLPQKRSSGLTTEEIADHADRDAAMQLLREGYNLVGTAHHHCSAAAFQSGTDKADETKQDGIHFTFGKLDTPKVDNHVRVTFTGITYNATLSNWIETPEAPEKVPAGLLDTWDAYWLAQPPEVAFPEEWKDRLVIPVAPVYSGYASGGYYGERNLSSTNGSLISYVNAGISQIKADETLAKYPDLIHIAAAIANGFKDKMEVTQRYEVLKDLVQKAWIADKGIIKTYTITRERAIGEELSMQAVEAGEKINLGQMPKPTEAARPEPTQVKGSELDDDDAALDYYTRLYNQGR